MFCPQSHSLCLQCNCCVQFYVPKSLCYVFVYAMFRLGSTCNHVLALLFKVDYAWQHGLTTGCMKACTETANVWIRPTMTDLKPMRAEDMIVVKPKLRPKGTRRASAKEAHAVRRLFKTERSKVDAEPLTLNAITDAVYPECSDGVVFRYSHEGAESSYEPWDDLNVCATEECASSGFTCGEQLMVSLVEYGRQHSDTVLPVYSAADRQEIELQTRGQADNKSWYIMREGRISASIAHDVYTRGTKVLAGDADSRDALVQIVLKGRPLNPLLPALQYGRDMEAEAVETYYVVQYTDHHNLTVDWCGLFIDENLSFLCASPDRVVHCVCCGSGLLEVKCPLTSADKKPTDAGLPYLKMVDNKFTLSRSHKYYTQIQCQLAVAGRDWCDFFVYSPCGYHLERIYLDKVFWQSRRQVLEQCFNTVVIPHLRDSK